jgi:hypothetical protein
MITQTELTSLLLKSSSGNEFLKLLFSKLKKDKKFSFSNFARRSGFSSRAYVRELFLGIKPLNLKNIQRFELGLGLNQIQSKYFKLLLKIDHPCFNPEKLSKEGLQKKIEQAKIRLNKRKKIKQNDSEMNSYLDWPMVYASLGGRPSLEDVVQRSKLPRSTVSRVLKSMLNKKLVTIEEEKYLMTQDHLELDPMTFKPVIQYQFIQTLKKGVEQAQNDFLNKNCCHFFSCLSIDEASFPKLKEELQQWLFNFVDRHEKSDGARVITIGLTAS